MPATMTTSRSELAERMALGLWNRYGLIATRKPIPTFSEWLLGQGTFDKTFDPRKLTRGKVASYVVDDMKLVQSTLDASHEFEVFTQVLERELGKHGGNVRIIVENVRISDSEFIPMLAFRRP